MWKNWFTIFNVKVTTRAYIVKIWLFLQYLINCWSICNQTWLVVQHHKPECPVGKWNYFVSRSRSQRRFKMLVNVCPDSIFWTTEHFVAKRGMVVQHHKPECHAEKLVHFLKCQGHSEGLYNKDMTISVVSSKLLVGLPPNLVWKYSIIIRGVLWKNRITAFKVKVTANVQNVSECLCRWYFLCVSDHVCSVSLELLNHFFF